MNKNSTYSITCLCQKQQNEMAEITFIMSDFD